MKESHPPYSAFAPGSSWMSNQSTNPHGVLAPMQNGVEKRSIPLRCQSNGGGYPGFLGRACTCAPADVKFWLQSSRERAVLYCRRRKLRRRGGSTCKIPGAQHRRSLHQGFGCILPCGHVVCQGSTRDSCGKAVLCLAFQTQSDGR